MNSVCICSADEFTGAFIDVMWLDNRKKRFHLVDGLAAAAAITYFGMITEFKANREINVPQRVHFKPACTQHLQRCNQFHDISYIL